MQSTAMYGYVVIGMLCNEISAFPDKVDEMTFFQDVSLNTIEDRNEYQRLLSNGKYSEADMYINRQNNIYGYFACFFNMLENRIYALQEYISKKEKINPMTHQSESPTTAIANTTIWTGGKYTIN